MSRCRFFIRCLVIVAALLSASLAAAETINIGVFYWSMNIPGQVAMRKGLEAEAAKINLEAKKHGRPKVKLMTQTAGDGQEGITRQELQMKEMVRQKPHVIIVQPTNNAALAGPLREANQAGIPVVAYDQYIAGGKLAAYLTSDNYQAGYLNGEYASSRFPAGKTINLVLVDYPHISSTVERVNGFLDALKDLKRPYRLLKTYQAVEPVSGRKAGEALLRDFPQRGSVDPVFTVNDGGGLSLVDRLQQAGRSEIMTATVDGDPVSVENIRKKRLTVINTAQFCGPLGAQALQAAYRIAQGQQVPRHQLIPVFPVTTETIRRYPGWQGPVPGTFKKPWPSKKPVWEGAVRAVQP